MLDHGCIGGPDPLQEMDFLESPTAQGFGREIGQQNINSQSKRSRMFRGVLLKCTAGTTYIMNLRMYQDHEFAMDCIPQLGHPTPSFPVPW
eukprot:scaffold803_cov367-Pavlova_lutheri.AAC.15